MTVRTGAWITIAVIAAATIAAVLLCDNKPTISGSLIDFGFTPADPQNKPPDTPHDKPTLDYPEIVTGTGYIVTDSVIAAGDTLDVKLTVLQHGGVKYVQVTVDGKPVRWMELKSYNADPPSRNLSVIVELDYNLDVSFGLAWDLLTIGPARVGLYGVTDLDTACAGVRVSRRIWRGSSLGGEGGYGTDGWCFGASVGVAF